jgi:Uma2 family endonuclease
MTVSPTTKSKIVYPESDGKPMADNTLQFRWIVTLQGGLDAIFKDRADVFVAGDLLWYPVEYHPEISSAPDTLVVFGRPKGDRRSYLQWKEDGIGPQVVFEVLSPTNSNPEMERKRFFYERYGVKEYYLYDPDKQTLRGWQRHNEQLVRIEPIAGWVSPRLGIRFEPGELPGQEWRVYGPDGRALASYLELYEQRELAEQRARRAELRVEQAQEWAEQERMRAEEERWQRELVEQRIQQTEQLVEQERTKAEQERVQREQAEARAERLAAQLRELGLLPDE